MFPPGLAGGPPAAGHAPPALVSAILQRMHGGPPGPSGEPDADEKQNGKGMSTLDQIQSLIQDLHDAMRNITDPQIVNVLATCLKAVTGVQQQLMSQGGGR